MSTGPSLTESGASPTPTAPVSAATAPKSAVSRKIFISYRRDDSAPTAGRIYDRLIASFGKDAIFKDVDNIPYGEKFPSYITGVIAKCSVLLAIIGPRWLDAAKPDGTRRLDDPKDWVRIEIETALASGVTVIPILVHGARTPKAPELPESLHNLAQINSLAVRNDPDFNTDMRRLQQTLARWVPERRGRFALLRQLRRHRFAFGLVFSAIVAISLLTFLDLSGYRDDVQYAAAFLGGAVLAGLGVLAVLLLVGALTLQRIRVVIGRALSVAVVAVIVVLPFASPLLTSECGTLSCPAPAPADQQVLHVEDPTACPVFELDPAHMECTIQTDVGQLLFPSLMQLDSQRRAVPWAASGYRVSADGTTYTFTLRPGLQWSDGTPIQADDFAFAINRALDPCTAGSGAYLLLPIRDAKLFNNESCTNGTPTGTLQTLIGDSLLAPDPQTLMVKLEEPATYILAVLTTSPAFAVPRSLLQTYGDKWTDHLTDNGGWGGDLFTLTAVDRQVNSQQNTQTHVVLTRNDRFWGTKPKLRRVELTVFHGDDTFGYRDYVAGTGDVDFVSTSDLESARLRGAELHSLAELGLISYSVNWAVPPFDDVRMRQAFQLALDKGKLVSDTFGDRFIPTNHLVPEGMPGYNPNLTGPVQTGLQGNAQRAQALAQTYANEKCGGSLSACPPVTLIVITSWPGATDMATEAQQMWQRSMPGYPTSVQRVAGFGDELKAVTTRQAQLWLNIWGPDYPDPRDALSVQYLPGADLNTGQVSLPAATILMQKADGETDQAARLSNYEQAEQALVNNVAAIPLYQLKFYYLMRPFVVGQVPSAAGGATSDIWQRIYISQH